MRIGSLVFLMILGACNIEEHVPVVIPHDTAMIIPDVHDPANIVRIDDTLVLFASAVEWRTYDPSTNTWPLGGDHLYASRNPTWYDGSALWAPGVAEVNGEWRLYHSSVISENRHESRLGFVPITGSAPGFNFMAQPDYVVESTETNTIFAIDPSVFIDDEGRNWLVYGSHDQGIAIVELDPATGYLLVDPEDKTWSADDPRFTHLANYGGTLERENNVEAPYIYNRPDSEYYYLFVNWDRCCNDIESTYNIRVGRSTSPTGPYLDRSGQDMAEGYGTEFLDANGEILGDFRFHGPGHAGIYVHTDGNTYFSHHFYDDAQNGMPTVAVWHLTWADDWPQIDLQTPVNFSS